MVEFMGYSLTTDEADALNTYLKIIREEKERARKIQNCKTEISFQISDAIDQIGLAETKKIVRELARELRSFKEEDK